MGFAEWKKYAPIFLMVTGGCLLLAGIVSFFAFNWEDLHKFAKFSIILALIFTSLGFGLAKRNNELIFQLSLTACTILIGVLFAVYGQVYQTGANAYDFFLTWLLLAIPFVAISRFPPLWTIWAILLNTTIILFAGQTMRLWTHEGVFVILGLLNIGIAFLWEYYLKKISGQFSNHSWFTYLFHMAGSAFFVILSAMVIFGEYSEALPYLWVLIGLIYFAGLFLHSYKSSKDLFQLGLPAVCFLIILDIFLGKWISEFFHDYYDLLLISIVIIVSTLIYVLTINRIYKSWKK
jgi:uncharacterized membrane protein